MRLNTRLTRSATAIASLFLFPICFLLLKGKVNPGTNLMWNDFVHQDFPWQAYIHARFSIFQIPYWNPFQSAGMDFIGSWQHRIFYPPRLILHFIFGPGIGIFAELIFALYAAMLGVYALLRHVRVQTIASIFGSVIFFLYCVTWIDWNTPVLSSMCWLPWITLCAFHLVERRRIQDALYMGVLASLMFLGGAAQWMYYICEFIFFLLVFLKARLLLAKEYRAVTRVIGLEFLAGVVFVLLTLGQLIAVYRVMNEGLFAHTSLTYEQFRSTDPSVWNPLEFATMRKLFLPGFSETIVLILTLSSFVLSFVYFKTRRSLIAFFLFCFVFYYLGSIGEATGFSKLYFTFNPLGSKFRMPKRMTVIFVFVSAIMLAFGLQLAIDYARLQLDRWKNVRTPGQPLSKGRAWILRILLSALFGAIIFLFINQNVVELTYMPSYDFKSYATEFRAKALGELGLKPQDRVEIVCNFEGNVCQNTGLLAHIQQMNVYDRMATYRTYLYQNRLVVDHAPDPGFVWIGDYYFLGKDRDLNLNLLRLAGVKYLFSTLVHFEELSAQYRKRHGELPLTRIPNSRIEDPVAKFLQTRNSQWANRGDLAEILRTRTGLDAYRLEGTVPRIFLHNSIRLSGSPDETANQMNFQFDPRAALIVEASPAIAARISALRKDPRDVMRSGEFERYDPERVEITVESAGDSVMVLTDQFFPGWKAWVDGKESEIFPVDLLFRGVLLEKGKHQVSFVYNPVKLKIGLIVSLMAWICVLVILSFGAMRRFNLSFSARRLRE